MELKDIVSLNQRIYELDESINRYSKVIFIASIVFVLLGNKEFQNPSKLTTFIDFTDETKKPIDQLINLAKDTIKNLNLQEKTKEAVLFSLNSISGVNTNLDTDRNEFQKFLEDFISKDFVSIKPGDLFFETLYMQIDKKASSSDKGVVLTPIFAAELMVDLADIDYKKDVVADLCSGTGLFSLISYSKMLDHINDDYKNGVLNDAEYNFYQKRLYNSIIANDSDSKMITLCLANFMLKSLNYSLIFYEDVLKLQKSSFKIEANGKSELIHPTKAILNPPYEDKNKPLEILEKNISVVKENGEKNNKVVVIIPPQKFGMKKLIFSRILNICNLETVIKMQDNLFSDSGKNQPASIFVFNTNHAHKSSDVIHYYNFTDTGFVYLKDSGLVDKKGNYNIKKDELLNMIKSAKNEIKPSAYERNFLNFYDVFFEKQIDAVIDPNKVKVSKEEADIAMENIITKKMLSEKDALIKSVNNSFIDTDGHFENYLINLLSEE